MAVFKGAVIDLLYTIRYPAGSSKLSRAEKEPTSISVEHHSVFPLQGFMIRGNSKALDLWAIRKSLIVDVLYTGRDRDLFQFATAIEGAPVNLPYTFL